MVEVVVDDEVEVVEVDEQLLLLDELQLLDEEHLDNNVEIEFLNEQKNVIHDLRTEQMVNVVLIVPL
jgi:hypothetical protein